jgi:hypothetical protein
LQSEDPQGVGYIPPSAELRGPNYKLPGYKAKRDFTQLFQKEIEEVAKENRRILTSRKVDIQRQLQEQASQHEKAPQTRELQVQLKQTEELLRQLDDSAVAAVISTPRPRVRSQDPRKLICQRCFALKHQGKVLPVKVPDNLWREKLANIR